MVLNFVRNAMDMELSMNSNVPVAMEKDMSNAPVKNKKILLINQFNCGKTSLVSKYAEVPIIIEEKYLMMKNDSRFPLSQVIICKNHEHQLDVSYVKKEFYFGSEECIVCEVNK